MAEAPPEGPGWKAHWGLSSRWVLGAVGVALVVRVLPMALWGVASCTRDECSYKVLARGIVDGDGLASPKGWLWAPGYPYLLAFFQEFFGSLFAVKGLQVLLALASVMLMYRIAAQVADRRTGVVAAWLYAVHPTLAYFTGTLWSEVVYSFLLLAGVAALLWAREGPWARGLAPGVLVGLCVLFRGVATYMVPIFALAALWPVRQQLLEAIRARWRHGAALVLGVLLTVGPYTLHASAKHGGLLISDATLGQMMFLGNNEFAPVTFDYGSGLTMNRARDPVFATGRPHCSPELPAALWSSCEVTAGMEWIRAHPDQFLARVPVRLAQLLNPHSFLTRHVRWGKWAGLPWLIEEVLCLYVVLTSLAVLLGGTVAVWARARGPYGLLAVGIVAYHLLAIAALAGLTRYRLPLEPLWMVYLAGLLVDPKGVVRSLRGWRLAGLLLSLPVLIVLIAWFLPAGYPGLW